MAAPRVTDTDSSIPDDDKNEWSRTPFEDYVSARLNTLSRQVQEQKEAQRRLVAYLVILGYVFVFAYLMGRDSNASNHGA